MLTNIPSHEYFGFGPYLASFNVDPAFTNRMLQTGRKLKQSHKKNLAGKIKTELLYDHKGKDRWITESYYPFIESYLRGYKKFAHMSLNHITGISLSSIWINFQKKNEFNPIHTHTNCILSFVHWIRFPQTIMKERKKDVTTSAGPGGITFHFGEDQPFVLTVREFLPKENTLMIFPSTLKHEVIAFKSDVSRISVAGNIILHYD
jgi:hypothetical protein